jgi:8-oxo-dGTP pyrophosphatase MutT (NUDIX family)
VTKTAISAGAIVLGTDNGRLLIAMAYEPDKGPEAYVIPKGHIEAGESTETAALREVAEEVGLTGLQLVTYLGAIVRPSVEDDGTKVEKTIHLFLGLVEGIPALADGARWLTPAKAIESIPFDEDRAFLLDRLAPLVSA